MEPVPETERMEEFRSSPIPRVRVERGFREGDDYLDTTTEKRKPHALRSSTEPIPPSPRSPGWNLTANSPLANLPVALPYRSRTSSPLSLGGHSRSRSTASALAPPMSRAQSLPGVNSALGSPHLRPSSPLGLPARFRALKRPADEIFPASSARELGDIGESETQVRQAYDIQRTESPLMNPNPGNAHPKNYRPPSPLRHLQYANSTVGYSNQSSALPSPKYNESFPGPGPYSHCSFGSWSVPSTPTSMRSRSPSISSLETIEDSPDAEEAALEAYNIAQLKAVADAADAAAGDEAQEARRKGTLDGGRGRTLGLGRDKRKRWSVCGAERRGDLDLETIWED